MLKDAIDLSGLRRVLVIKLRHHGDVLLTSPVFSVLKNHAPHLEVDALVYRDTADMLSLHPAIAEVHTVDRNWKKQGLLRQVSAEARLLSRLWRRHYDLIIHLTEHNRGAWLTRVLGVKHSVARKIPARGRFWRKSFSHFHPMPRGNPRHMVEVNLDALRRIGVYPNESERELTLVPGDAVATEMKRRLAQAGVAEQGFIHIHPASRWLFKCWPTGQMTALIRSLQNQGHRIVVTAAPDDAELKMVREILAPLEQGVVDLSGQLSLKQLAALSAMAQLFVGMDSAPMHIAAAMKTPVVVLFGPSGEKEWGPWQVPQRVLVSSHTCRPCGYDGCGGGKISECLGAISVERVLDAVAELLRQP
ncbi:putative lipopolysaccharide heptosyltransferase III [Sulfurimicrobium lacus]|uniref:Putative lipopolysaccharide heptosyltransferase III n=1 Tax=Sulfurimicrobium lacus TaxID=2715678 RepID=A0A6F8VFL0_9PROT|nr:putative lipopolysaccharide heptosyltransferase III [Sulfurimicrobium lacus]BCB28508.1 putative lipopolysaccharide heptosyltransferase III [Sulfurimicrobium lacus]